MAGRRGSRAVQSLVPARLNAVVHGVLAESPVVPGLEDERDWEALRDGVVASLEPEGYMEEELARRIASLQWRLRRLERWERDRIAMLEASAAVNRSYAAVLMRKVDAMLPSTIPDVDEDALESLPRAMLMPEQLWDKVPRYEAHLHRMLMQTMHELEAMQVRRKGGVAPLARMDVTGE